MQKFEYRTPRYLVDLPVLFRLQDANLPGRCKEISKEGMRIELQHPVAADACGTVSFSYKDLSLDLRVCVTHTGAEFNGLKFLFESDKDRSAVEHLVTLLAGSSGHSGPMLVR
ncbi:MAG TPA: PilZ domain-containing protein [Terracidiphilus sp.]|nr:PilZ domain-containing protein [Terracidiphilus sp.]